jgi:hypothetical protein
MRPTRIFAATALLVFPVVAAAQVSDTLQLGERVRVRVASTQGNTNLFTGNIAAISPDTLILAIPGGKGTIILPRASINEVAKSDGRVSRWRSVPFVAPLVFSSALVTSTLTQSRSGTARTQGVLLIGMNAALIARYVGRTPPERWRPVESWLNR